MSCRTDPIIFPYYTPSLGHVVANCAKSVYHLRNSAFRGSSGSENESIALIPDPAIASFSSLILPSKCRGSSQSPPHKKRPIFRVRPGKLVERTSTAFRPISPEWLSDALVFIDRNRFQPLTAAEVVARCNRSAHTVAKAFLKNFGLTPGRYITRIKMEEARRLVRLRTHSSKEIASLVGYTSPQYFCNAYRAYYGHSPFASSSYS